MATDRNETTPQRGGRQTQGGKAPAGGTPVRRQLPATRPHVESPTPSTIGVGDLSRLAGFEVDVTLLLGRTEITLEEVAKLDEQSLVIVDKRADEPVEALINGELFAHGKLVMVGNHYGVQLLKLVGRLG